MLCEVAAVELLVGNGGVEHNGNVGTQAVGECEVARDFILILRIECELTHSHWRILLATCEVTVGVLRSVVREEVLERCVGIGTARICEV